MMQDLIPNNSHSMMKKTIILLVLGLASFTLSAHPQGLGVYRHNFEVSLILLFIFTCCTINLYYKVIFLRFV